MEYPELLSIKDDRSLHHLLTNSYLQEIIFKKENQISTSTNIVAQKLADDFELATAIKFKRSLTNNQNKMYRSFKGRAEDLIKLINLEIE